VISGQQVCKFKCECEQWYTLYNTTFPQNSNRNRDGQEEGSTYDRRSFRQGEFSHRGNAPSFRGQYDNSRGQGQGRGRGRPNWMEANQGRASNTYQSNSGGPHTSDRGRDDPSFDTYEESKRSNGNRDSRPEYQGRKRQDQDNRRPDVIKFGFQKTTEPKDSSYEPFKTSPSLIPTQVIYQEANKSIEP